MPFVDDTDAQWQVAAHAGFPDQSQFSQHFMRVSAAPGQFRTLARIA
jgi:transcriptional regulator GlxA family with amidase domain